MRNEGMEADCRIKWKYSAGCTSVHFIVDMQCSRASKCDAVHWYCNAAKYSAPKCNVVQCFALLCDVVQCSGMHFSEKPGLMPNDNMEGDKLVDSLQMLPQGARISEASLPTNTNRNSNSTINTNTNTIQIQMQVVTMRLTSCLIAWRCHLGMQQFHFHQLKASELCWYQNSAQCSDRVTVRCRV